MLRTWARNAVALAAWRLGVDRERIARWVRAVSAATAPAQAAGSDAQQRAWARLMVYVRRNRARYALGGAVTLGYAAGFTAVPMLVGWAVAGVEQGLGHREVLRRCGWLAAATLVRGALRYVSRTQLFNLAREIEYEMRNDLFAHLQRLPQSFFQRWRTGDLMSRCVNDLGSVRLMLGPGALSLLQTPVLFLFVIARDVLAESRRSRCWCWCRTRSSCSSRAASVASMHRSNLDVQEGLAALSNQLQESIAGVAVVKTYAMEPAMAERFDAANETLYRAQLRLVRVNASMPAITMMLPAFAMWIVLWVGGTFIEQGRMQLSEFFSFAMFIYELTFPTFIMGWVFALLQRGRAAMQRIDEVLVDRAVDRRSRGDAARLDRLRGEIEFREPLVPLRRGPRGGAARRVAARAGRLGARRRGSDRFGQEDARVADPAPLRGAGRPALPRRRRREPHSAAHAALAHRDGPAGRLPVLDDARRERRVRASRARIPARVREAAGARAARQGRRRAARRLRHARRRARRDALGRAAPAHRARPRARAAARAS